MTEEKLKHLNQLDYELRHGERDKLTLLGLIQNPKNFKELMEDNRCFFFDDDVISDMASNQLMRVIARLGKAQKEWDSL